MANLSDVPTHAIAAHRGANLSTGHRLSVQYGGTVQLPDGDWVAAYALTLWTSGGAVVWTSGTDPLSLPFRDDRRALGDGAGFLSAYGDRESGCGRYVPELAPFAGELSELADY